jgi:hypothetical protein
MVGNPSQTRKAPKRLTALAVTLLASLAVVGVAAGSASALSLVPSNSSYPVQIQSSKVSGTQWFVESVYGGKSTVVSCTGGLNRLGQYTNGTQGTLNSATITGCTKDLQFECHSAGFANGTIQLASLATKLVYLNAAHTRYGLLLSRPEKPNWWEDPGPVAEFTCAGGIQKVSWRGSVLGEYTSPALNKKTTSATLVFENGGSHQNWQQIEGAGTVYHLTQSVNGGAQEEAALHAYESHSFPTEVTFVP